MKPDALIDALALLRERGLHVERMDFPPVPFPGLWNIGGWEMTENQVITFAAEFAEDATP
jgi:hypothetical protein